MSPDRRTDSDSWPGERPRLADDAAFEAVFRKHYEGLCAFANGIVRAPDLAEEIVQDTFAGLWLVRASIRFRTTIRAYLYTAVRNRSLNHTRHATLERKLLSLSASRTVEDLQPGPSPDPELTLEQSETAVRVQRAIGRLTPRCREVITLRWLHGLSHAEIADIMGVSKKAVENNISRGLRSMRESMLPDHY